MLKAILIDSAFGMLALFAGFLTGRNYERRKKQIEMMKNERDWVW